MKEMIWYQSPLKRRQLDKIHRVENFEEILKSAWQSRLTDIWYQSCVWKDRCRTDDLPARHPKSHNNRIYDNLTEMQPWIYSNKDQDESFKNDLWNIFQNEPNQANYGSRENVNVYLSVLNLNWRDPWDGALTIINMRVWSWLRMNAGGVPNTCKSNGVKRNFRMDLNLVADGWVTRG